MYSRQTQLIFLAFILAIFLSGCGTFEIGIESNTIQESTISTDSESSVATVTPFAVEPTVEPPAQPEQSEQDAIEAALAEKLGFSIGEVPFAITQITELHAKGNVSNGYFLAAKQEGQWAIVYDGQANPPCRDIDFAGFSAELVPECLNENGQLIVRSGGDYVLVGEALAEYHGRQPGEINYSIIQDFGTHALGYAQQGYFLAAKTGDRWLIAYAGNGTPYCAQVDLHNFPAEMVPECMDANNNLVYRTGSVSPPISSLTSLDCGPGSAGAIQGSVESVACTVQDALRSRNTAALLGYMEDPFIIGYWLSEAVWGTPEEMILTIQGLYNFRDEDYVPRLTFTTDRNLFPELEGRSIDDTFGPDVDVVLVVYSQGWGYGDDDALLYFTQAPDGTYKFHGMLTGIQ